MGRVSTVSLFPQVSGMAAEMRRMTNSDGGLRSNRQIFNAVATGEAGASITFSASRQMMNRQRRRSHPALPTTTQAAAEAVLNAAEHVRRHHAFNVEMGNEVRWRHSHWLLTDIDRYWDSRYWLRRIGETFKVFQDSFHPHREPPLRKRASPTNRDRHPCTVGLLSSSPDRAPLSYARQRGPPLGLRKRASSQA